MAVTGLHYIIAFLLSLHWASARHVTCTWHPGVGTPTQLGFSHFCTADRDPHNRYLCKDGASWSFGRQVADWNVLRPDILELGEAKRC